MTRYIHQGDRHAIHSMLNVLMRSSIQGVLEEVFLEVCTCQLSSRVIHLRLSCGPAFLVPKPRAGLPLPSASSAASERGVQVHRIDCR